MSRRLNLLYALNRVDSVTHPQRSWGLWIESGTVFLFIAGGLIGIIWIFCHSIYPEWRIIWDFKQTTCEVEAVKLGQKKSGPENAVLFRPEVQIEYRVKQVQYKRWVYDFNTLNNGGYCFSEAEAQNRLQPFAVGKKFYCWYDPEDPSKAVLFQSWTFSNVWILVVPLSFLLLGLGPLVHLSVFHWGRSREQAAHLAQQTGLATPMSEEVVCVSEFALTDSGRLKLCEDENRSAKSADQFRVASRSPRVGGVGEKERLAAGLGSAATAKKQLSSNAAEGLDVADSLDSPNTRTSAEKRIVFPAVPSAKEIMNSPGVRLKYRLPLDYSPLWGMSVLGAACLIWNFLVLMFLSVAVGYILDGQPDWGLLLFVVPFLLIGFALIGYFLYKIQILTAVGPTLLEIDDMPLKPGQTANILLIQTGAHQFKSFNLKLVCEEEVVFSYGTDIRQETSTIYNQELLERGDFVISAEDNWEQELPLTIPPFAMHSFEAPHNRVRWRLIVEGVVENAAPFTRRFALVVIPEIKNQEDFS